ncbi:MAG: MBL fold metallo-hydrolase [Candidatus Pacearchaeota archaeon]
MQICALGSGSSGNCYYIESNKQAILVDAGLTFRQINERLALIGKSIKNVKGIFITHEHIDHIRGCDVLARQLHIPIFVNQETSNNCFLCSNQDLINLIKNNETINFAGLEISAFKKSHDASNPLFYSISNKNKKISIITDLGKICKNVINGLQDSNFLFFESNHDEQMLDFGPYPYFLKERIKSEFGHLSNRKSGLAVIEYASSKLKHIVLSHLSKINNTPEIALKTFKNLVKERRDLKPKISVSLRDKPTEIFKI